MTRGGILSIKNTVYWKRSFLKKHCFSFTLDCQPKMFFLPLKKVSKNSEFYGKNTIFALITNPPGVNFIKQFTLDTWNLHSVPIFFNKFTLIGHYAFAHCNQLFAFSFRFWVHSTLYALCPTFMKSTPGFINEQYQWPDSSQIYLSTCHWW